MLHSVSITFNNFQAKLEEHRGIPTAVHRCANDANSVAAWIEEDKLDPRSSVVRYVKFQGSKDSVRGLPENDFMLVLMQMPQIAWLVQLYRPIKNRLQ